MSFNLQLPCALMLIDLQQAIDAAYWGPRNNPQAETNITALLAAWRKLDWPIVHVRHDSMSPQSAYRAAQPGHDFKPEAMPLPGETVVPKSAHSAFVGTALHERLRTQEIETLVVAGVLTDNSVEATVRHGADLGWPIVLVEDACFTVDRRLRDGRLVRAADMHARSLALMDGEYAEIVTAPVLLEWIVATTERPVP